MKTCPTCGARAFDDAEVCFGCLHRYGEEPVRPNIAMPTMPSSPGTGHCPTLRPKAAPAEPKHSSGSAAARRGGVDRSVRVAGICARDGSGRSGRRSGRAVPAERRGGRGWRRRAAGSARHPCARCAVGEPRVGERGRPLVTAPIALVLAAGCAGGLIGAFFVPWSASVLLGRAYRRARSWWWDSLDAYRAFKQAHPLREPSPRAAGAEGSLGLWRAQAPRAAAGAERGGMRGWRARAFAQRGRSGSALLVSSETMASLPWRPRRNGVRLRRRVVRRFASGRGGVGGSGDGHGCGRDMRSAGEDRAARGVRGPRGGGRRLPGVDRGA